MPTPTPPAPCPACASTSAQLDVVRRAITDLAAKLGRMEAPEPLPEPASYLAAEGTLGELVMPPSHPPITVTVRVGGERGRVLRGEELRAGAPSAKLKAEAPSAPPGHLLLRQDELDQLIILAELLNVPRTSGDDPSVAPRRLRRLVEGITARAEST